MSLERRFDDHARSLHAQALGHLSPATRARLRQARMAAPGVPVRTWRLPLVAAIAVACVLGIGLRLSGIGTPVPAPPDAITAASAPQADTGIAMLDDDPAFYAWLASSDAVALATE